MSGKGKSVTCWVCNKTGHMSRDCYNKGKSKGKGKVGNASKDGNVVCYSCGGNHFARYCTSNVRETAQRQRQRERQQQEQEWKEDEQWETRDSQWREPQWERDSEVWETTTDSAQPSMFGTLDVNAVLERTWETILLRAQQGPEVDQVQLRHGSSYDSPTCGTC